MFMHSVGVVNRGFDQFSIFTTSPAVYNRLSDAPVSTTRPSFEYWVGEGVYLSWSWPGEDGVSQSSIRTGQDKDGGAHLIHLGPGQGYPLVLLPPPFPHSWTGHGLEDTVRVVCLLLKLLLKL